MLRLLQFVKTTFLASPMICLSFGIAAWLGARILLQWLHPYVSDSFALDLHFYDGSPVAGPYDMTDTAFYLGGIGLVLGVVALFRRSELKRWWAPLAIILNIGAYVITVLINAWALFPPPGIDY